jgi:hypothetical protein
MKISSFYFLSKVSNFFAEVLPSLFGFADSVEFAFTILHFLSHF